MIDKIFEYDGPISDCYWCKRRDKCTLKDKYRTFFCCDKFKEEKIKKR